MNNLDMDTTIEFVWDWIAQLNAHVLSHNWGTVGVSVHSEEFTRGLSSSSLQALSAELFKMIFASENPELFMKAMSRQMQAFQTLTRFPQLPHAYVKIVQEADGSEKSRWDLPRFTQALRTDITRIVECYKLVEEEANLQYAAATKHTM